MVSCSFFGSCSILPRPCYFLPIRICNCQFAIVNFCISNENKHCKLTLKITNCKLPSQGNDKLARPPSDVSKIQRAQRMGQAQNQKGNGQRHMDEQPAV